MQLRQETERTLTDMSATPMRAACVVGGQRTIISHSYVRHYFLQHRLPLDELLVLRLGSMQLRAEFL